MDTKPNNINKDSIDLRQVISVYLGHWKWFVLCMALALALAFFIIRYSTPQYNATAKIQIIEDNNASSELNAFQDLDMLSKGKNNVEDEMEAIASRSNFMQIVQKLNLNTKIEAIGKVINTEMYEGSLPFYVEYKEPDSILNNTKGHFFIELISTNSFGFSSDFEEPFTAKKFGSKIVTGVGEIQVRPKKEILGKFIGKKFKVSVIPVYDMAEHLQKKVIVSQTGKISNILKLSIDSPSKKKGRDILNTLIMTYNDNAISNQKYLADRTSEFIDSRIEGIYSNLTAMDSTAENLKEKRGITDIASQSNLNMSLSAQREQELQATAVQLDITQSLLNSVNNDASYSPLVSNLNNGAVQSVISNYNGIALERKKLLESTGQAHPRVVQMTQQMNSMKSNIVSNLRSSEDNLSVRYNNLSKQLANSNSKLYSSAGNSRALNEISRDQDNMAALYQYLIRKREEAQIKAASTSPKCNIIDAGYNSSQFPVSPKKTILYLAALIIGGLIPFSVIYVKELLDNKIRSKQELEKLVNYAAPVIAELPSIGKKQNKLIQKNDRSILAESLRILRTNLDYLIGSKGNSKTNIIYVTSSISGEGKTFLSSNLSLILANTEKKVLLVGADIRNPKLHTIWDTGEGKDVKELRNRIGLTDYLSNRATTLDQITNKLHVADAPINVIFSGRIPPNPSELLMNGRLKTLLDEASDNYEYIIVDTSPMVGVTDTLLISDYADQLIYVTRAGYTDSKIIVHPLTLLKDGKIKNLSFVLNDVKEAELGYGGKYGYGYGVNKKKWWQFFKK